MSTCDTCDCGLVKYQAWGAREPEWICECCECDSDCPNNLPGAQQDKLSAKGIVNWLPMFDPRSTGFNAIGKVIHYKGNVPPAPTSPKSVSPGQELGPDGKLYPVAPGRSAPNSLPANTIGYGGSGYGYWISPITGEMWLKPRGGFWFPRPSGP